MKTLVTFLLGCLFLAPIIAITTVFDGYTLSILWGWFVIPTFSVPEFTVPALTIPTAIGLRLVVSIFAGDSINFNDMASTSKEFFGKFFLAVVISMFGNGTALLLGWIVLTHFR